MQGLEASASFFVLVNNRSLERRYAMNYICIRWGREMQIKLKKRVS